MTIMHKPSIDAERLHIVQRAARYVLTRDKLGQARYSAMDVFPPELHVVKSGTSEYAWRWQLAWTWAKAGYMHETLSGTGLSKHRSYTILQAGREALEHIATHPALASFYIKNRRTAGTAGEGRSPEYYRPPELLRLASSSSKGLRLVPTKIDPFSASVGAAQKASHAMKGNEAPGNDTESDAESDADASEEDQEVSANANDAGVLGDVRDALNELRGLPAYFEQISSVLERMNERLTKVEGETRDQSSLLLEASERMTLAPQQTGKDAPATRDEIATVLAELTQSFLKDNPQNVGFTAIFDEVAEATLAEAVSKRLRIVVSEEISRVLAKDVGKHVAPMVREVVSQEIGPAFTPVIETVVRSEEKSEAHANNLARASDKHVERVIGEKLESAFGKLDARIQALGSGLDAAVGRFEKTAATMDEHTSAYGAVLSKIIEQRFEALASSIEARLSAITPDAKAIRELSEKLQSEVSSTCEELKDNLAAISANAQDLAERVDAVTDSFNTGHLEFKRQGAIVVENFKNVSNAAQDVLAAADAVSREMIGFAKLRATKDVSYETAIEIGDTAIARLAAASEKVGSSATSLGGGLIRPVGDNMNKGFIIQPKKDKEPSQ
jgi:hypothetical protein